MNNNITDLVENARLAQKLLNPCANNILSIRVSQDRIEIHLDGVMFREAANKLNVIPQGDWHESGWHCGFEIVEEGKPTVRLHSLLQ